jgi:galactokinase
MAEAPSSPARTRALHAFRERYGAPAPFVGRAPGRVNLIGEHTDYNDGFVLPMAIDRDVCIAFRPREDARVTLHSLEFDRAAQLDLRQMRTDHARSQQSGEWTEYVKAVAWSLQAGDDSLERGLEGVLACDVPVGAGLSSSAALELAVARSLAQTSGLAWDGTRAALACRRAENDWIGVQSGIMDPLISACGREGHALLIDCRSLETRLVPIPHDVAIVVLDTGTRRGLLTSLYNERREQCREAAAHFGKKALRDVYLGTISSRFDELDPMIRRRARHVVTENSRTIAAAVAFERSDMQTVGALMDESHLSLRNDFEVSSAELDAMVAIARAQTGCYGARMTGAGFGGCAVALVRAELATDFATAVGEQYNAQTGKNGKAYVCVASEGATVDTGA